MAYGIESFTGTGYLQFSSELEYLKVIDTQSVAHTSSVTYDNANELLAFSRSTTGYIRGNHNSALTQWTNASGDSVNIMKLERVGVEGIPGENEDADYGIRVFGSSSQLLYSSNFKKGQELINVHADGSLVSASDPNENALHPLLYDGDPTGIWIVPGQMRATTTSQERFYLNNSHWDYTDDEIQFIGTYGFVIIASFIDVASPNVGAILVLKQKEG